jgi:hypothetical protein
MNLPHDLERLSHEQFIALWKQIEAAALRGHIVPESYRAKLEAEALRRKAESEQELANIDREIHHETRSLVQVTMGTRKVGRMS